MYLPSFFLHFSQRDRLGYRVALVISLSLFALGVIGTGYFLMVRENSRFLKVPHPIIEAPATTTPPISSELPKDIASSSPETPSAMSLPSVSTQFPPPEEPQTPPAPTPTPPPPSVSPHPEGKYIALRLYPEHYAYLKNPGLWIEQLDAFYEALRDLVGEVPFGGQKITIEAVAYAQGAEMLAGNPIQWQADFIPEKLQSISEKNDLSYGPVHELAHDFDIYFTSAPYLIGDGPINPEQWANLKVTYVADTLSRTYPNATFFQTAVGYLTIGEFSHNYFYEVYAKPWVESGRTDWQNMHHDVYTGLLYSLKDRIGWEPFKETFREYATFTFSPPASDLEKIELFARTLSKHAVQDLTSYFRAWGFGVYP